MANTEAQDAVVRNLSLIGEDVKSLSTEFRGNTKRSSGPKSRGRLVHEYFSLDWDILWDVVQARTPRLKDQVPKLLDEAAE